MSQSAAPAMQNDMPTCLESFPHRHGEATGKPETRDETRGSIKTSISCETFSNFDTLFSYGFSLEPENLLPQNRCFLRGFRQSQNATPATKFTLSPLDAALTMRFAKAHNTTRLKCCVCHENCNSFCENDTKVLPPPQKTIFDTLHNTSECHEVPRLPRETKQRDVYATFETSKNDPFCRTYQRHGHTGIARTVANGCGRLWTVRQRRANTPSTPRPLE